MDHRLRRFDDLAFVRRGLEVAREHGEPFEPMWQALVTHVAERPIGSQAEDDDRSRALNALTDLRDHWRACYERAPEPRGRYAGRCAPLYDPDLDGAGAPKCNNTPLGELLTDIREIAVLFPEGDGKSHQRRPVGRPLHARAPA